MSSPSPCCKVAFIVCVFCRPVFYSCFSSIRMCPANVSNGLCFFPSFASSTFCCVFSLDYFARSNSCQLEICYWMLSWEGNQLYYANVCIWNEWMFTPPSFPFSPCSLSTLPPVWIGSPLPVWWALHYLWRGAPTHADLFELYESHAHTQTFYSHCLCRHRIPPPRHHPVRFHDSRSVRFLLSWWRWWLSLDYFLCGRICWVALSLVASLERAARGCVEAAGAAAWLARRFGCGSFCFVLLNLYAVSLSNGTQ